MWSECPRRAGGPGSEKKREESDDDGRNVDCFALHAVALDVRLAEDLFVGTLSDVELFGEAFQRVGALADTRGLPETRHVHGIAGKPLDGDPLVPEFVVIETIVVKHLFDRGVFEIGFEVLQCPMRLIQVIDPDSRSVPKVVLWSTVDGRADHFAVS